SRPPAGERTASARLSFSPPAPALVPAGGTADNPLQVWRLPTTPGVTRALQIGRLAIGASEPTCGVFSPDGQYAVVGTKDNRVLVFARPEKAKMDRVITGKISRIDASIDSPDRKVNVWADVPNPDKILMPGDTV